MPSEQADDPSGLPEIQLANRQTLPLDSEGLTSVARATLRGEGAGAELSISFVTVDEMSRLHQQYLGESGPTDVLAFPMDEERPQAGRTAEPEEPRLLGDVVICPEYASANNPDVVSELRLLLVHGILHLLGYDHEEERERAEMWARQERYSGVRVESPRTGEASA